MTSVDAVIAALEAQGSPIGRVEVRPVTKTGTKNERALGKEFVQESLGLWDGGSLYWKERPRHHFVSDNAHAAWNGKFAGRIAGIDGGKGYIEINFRRGGRYWSLQAHRVVWMLSTGEWPVHVIDHINRIRDDNRIENLRDVPADVNARNNGKTGGTELFGAYRSNRSARFRAQVMRNDRAYYLGMHDTPEQASEAATAFRTAFVLVTPNETVLSEHTDPHTARREQRDRQDEGQSVDLMRREADGTLSTELR